MYPIYRKYAHNKTYYKVESDKHLTEIIVLGKVYSINEIEAKILPDRNFIADVIANENNFLVSIAETDFIAFEKHCIENLTKSKF